MKPPANDISISNHPVDPRAWALNILNRQETTHSYINILLDSEFQKIKSEPSVKAFATELIYGIIRNKRYIDWIIDSLKKNPTASLPIPVVNLLRMGIYQILMMNSVPDFAAVNETVTLADKQGLQKHKGFINGMLRNVIRKRDSSDLTVRITDPAKRFGIQYSHPDWIVKIYMSVLGVKNAEKLLIANNQIPPTFIRVNTLKISTSAYMELLNKANILYAKSELISEAIELKQGISPRNLPGYQEGFFHVQDVAAQLIAYCLQPKPGSIVYDLCAAPGGKTFVLTQLMKDKGKIKAFDIHEGRLRMLSEQSHKLGCSIIKTYPLDLSGKIPESLYETADYILADVPCSGLGVLRRKLDARWAKNPSQIKELLKIQENILNNASLCLKPGGILVYSTCTYTIEENENQVKIFLSKHPEYQLESFKIIFPENIHHLVTESGYLKTLPFRDNIDGMFACRMKKGK